MPLYIKELIIRAIYSELFKIYSIFKEESFIKGLNRSLSNLYKL
jgi:hypothetical protein